MLVYQSNPETGEYVGSREARRDPLEPDRYLIPRGAVTEAPPEVKENQAAVLGDNAWQIVDDFRGVEYWTPDGEKHTIENLGETKPENALDAEPETPPMPIDRVDNWRFKALLRQDDLFDRVDAAVRDNASPEAIIAWDAGAPISRESPAVNQIADMLGLDLDDLLTRASKVTL